MSGRAEAATCGTGLVAPTVQATRGLAGGPALPALEKSKLAKGRLACGEGLQRSPSLQARSLLVVPAVYCPHCVLPVALGVDQRGVWPQGASLAVDLRARHPVHGLGEGLRDQEPPRVAVAMRRLLALPLGGLHDLRVALAEVRGVQRLGGGQVGLRDAASGAVLPELVAGVGVELVVAERLLPVVKRVVAVLAAEVWNPLQRIAHVLVALLAHVVQALKVLHLPLGIKPATAVVISSCRLEIEPLEVVLLRGCPYCSLGDEASE
mmetsp:Transcript_94503/g.282149  ORF Transcript_94503/g.282149 Transcript_94503/m.282149 type:complete len:265 (+) Transcript_94503:266-1060(+)|eukprot:CAMPEP_0175253434 /NCGR_PEP_ID=MMETSP0093-20121207/36683_1 /TAXON_ID=311494 /ORGANISM="Alexandrium monilatum, Strain CCMP3105" /LENGTH=264 /DNA_ID=CAMNT_0016547743 /DNA_START=262 /DNA_END=1056 /DNA_ORIENTATION=+